MGEYTKRVLLSYFKSLSELKKASIKELTLIPGIGEKRAKLIKEWLREKN